MEVGGVECIYIEYGSYKHQCSQAAVTNDVQTNYCHRATASHFGELLPTLGIMIWQNIWRIPKRLKLLFCSFPFVESSDMRVYFPLLFRFKLKVIGPCSFIVPNLSVYPSGSASTVLSLNVWCCSDLESEELAPIGLEPTLCYVKIILLFYVLCRRKCLSTG